MPEEDNRDEILRSAAQIYVCEIILLYIALNKMLPTLIITSSDIFQRLTIGRSISFKPVTFFSIKLIEDKSLPNGYALGGTLQ